MKDGLLFTSESYNWAKSIPAEKYGKSSEVANAHIKSVMVLLTTNSTNPCKIHDFYKRFIAHISTLDTMSKLNKINGYVEFTLHKLCGIRAELVRTDDNWQNWGFNELIEAIRICNERNPIERLKRSDRSFKEQHQKKHIMKTLQKTKTRERVYCRRKDHKRIAYSRIQNVNEK